MQGRPKKPENEKLTEMIRIKVKPELKKKLFEEAGKREITVSQLIREAIRTEAKRSKISA